MKKHSETVVEMPRPPGNTTVAPGGVKIADCSVCEGRGHISLPGTWDACPKCAQEAEAEFLYYAAPEHGGLNRVR